MNNRCFCKAIIHGDSWRKELWERVFGVPEVPIVQPFPIERGVIDGDIQIIYRLDLDRVSQAQLWELCKGIAKHFDLSAEEVLADTRRMGFIAIKGDSSITTIGCQIHTLGGVL